MTIQPIKFRSRAQYSATVFEFLRAAPDEILGEVVRNGRGSEEAQTWAWRKQIELLQVALAAFPDGSVYFEFEIPRVGKRADVVLVLDGVIMVIEFKVGAREFSRADLAQAEGYAVDLKNFHEGSRLAPIVPILVATEARDQITSIDHAHDLVYIPLTANATTLGAVIAEVHFSVIAPVLDPSYWSESAYRPTPTIIEAATYLYANHNVTDIAQSGAAAENLNLTSMSISRVIGHSRRTKRKSICFVTGVPGAGKTLVGLNIATSAAQEAESSASLAVYLSGNGPLVKVLREALARDQKLREGVPMDEARRSTKRFIQNIHNFRDDTLANPSPPAEHIVIFDEAQRAWDRDATSNFMRRKKDQPNFDQSEPAFLIGVMDRHEDWCAIVALIGGGQEIGAGEAGLPGWFEALAESYDNWDVYYSDKLSQPEYDGGKANFSALPANTRNVTEMPGLHLSTSMRSFRAERLSHMVHHTIANHPARARVEADLFRSVFPIMITRDLARAKDWVVGRSRGNESHGVIASSGGMRLRPYGIQVKNDIDEAIWFLNAPDDIRTSYFMETVATEFDIQGLELDWCLVAWDADLRHNGTEFEHFQFTGKRWNRRKKAEGRIYLENAYRVLLTRARQGMIIFVPEGDPNDATRLPSFYDQTFEYLVRCGLEVL